MSMHIILFTHPNFLKSQSMPRFAKLIAEGMQERGHTVEIWTPEAMFFKMNVPASLKKWMGYIDQYIVFPRQVRKKLKASTNERLYVFADQALGPWIPLVANLPHVVHCHDFLAQYSAIGKIKENPTSTSGKKYQDYIRAGYTKAKNFISVSKKTREDLHYFLNAVPRISEVVYNGLNQELVKENQAASRNKFQLATGIDVSGGYILHVGGNQWYKNRKGVIEICDELLNISKVALPLIMIGAKANSGLMEAYTLSKHQNNIHLLSDIDDDLLRTAYSGASLMLYPSLAEGFGWPIAEAMALGCPVITTNAAPMSEVGGDAAFYIERRPFEESETKQWAKDSAKVVDAVINMSLKEHEQVVASGIVNAMRFNPVESLNQIEKIYKVVLDEARS